MERMLRILLALADKEVRGLSARRLGAIAGYAVDTDSGLSALRRDLRQLRDRGWDIESRGGEGAEGHYVLHARDNRMALLLTPGEQAALQSALLGAEHDVPVPSGPLAELERAVEQRCLTRFTYRHKRRTVHPHTLHNGPSGWMLRGREVESGLVKEFVVRRMSGPVAIGRPRSAAVPEPVPKHSFDPMTWQVDPPLEVTLATTPDFEYEVCQAMTGSRVIARNGDEVLVSVLVTHRAAFRSRLLELGLRVQIVGPPEARKAVLARLHAMLEGSA
jgi:predicted DNA-binding transcriptional regulator YafY